MATLDEYNNVMAALCIWREARGEPRDGKLAVMWVILNRKNDPHNRWPNTYAKIVLQPLQFSSFNRNDPNAALLATPTDSSFYECCQCVDAPGLSDPTLGANCYHAYPEGDPHWPSWATPEHFTVKIGKHSFYRL